MRKFTILRLVLPLVAAAALLVLAMPRVAHFPYDYRKGAEWKYETLFAPFDFPIYKTDAQLQEERLSASSATIPYYKYSQEIVNRNLKLAQSLDLGDIRPVVVSELQKLFGKGILSDDGLRDTSSGVLYVQHGKRAEKTPSSEVYTLSDARSQLYANLLKTCDNPSLDSLLRASGVYNLVVPNLLFDRQTTELVNASRSTPVSPTQGYVSAGELIVSNSEIVTAEVAQVLDSYRREYESNVGSNVPEALFWLGNVLLAVVIVILLFLIIYYNNKRIFRDSRYFYVLLVFLIASLTSLVVLRIDESLLYLVPFTLTPLYLQAFVRAKVIVPVYVVSLLPMLIFAHDGPALFVMFLFAGSLSIFLFKFFGKGWKQFLLALIAFALLGVCYFAFSLLGLVSGSTLRNLLFLFIASFLAVAGYPLIYLFEKVFNLVSSSRLQELCDTSNSLLRTLESKAPGTFQHSLQVMNMADAAARSIDADPLLVRAGALYHDIGKMNNPLCFVENESLLGRPAEEKYHHDLPPEVSAHDIMCHVTDGVEMAEKFHLPSVVIDFIRSHHGTSRTGYFWSTFLSAGGDPSREAEFRYPGMKPVTKEQIILMLCDSLEAGARTLQNYSPESCSSFVEKIVASKMEEGQFDDADISIRDLGILKESLKTYIAQMHHERITYPDKKFKLFNKNESRKKTN